jgi:intracellular septation protein
MTPTTERPQSKSAPADGTEDVAKPTPPADEKAGLKLIIDLAPLAVFFIAYRFVGMLPATAILVVATLLSVVAAKVLLGKVSPMLIVSAVLVTFFGGLTLALDDPRFIKIKPTIVNLLFAGLLAFGLVSGRNFLKFVLGEALHLTAVGWRQLTLRWIGLFTALAILNEIVWRTQTESTWVNFKFPGMLVLTLVFTALQVPLIRRHAERPAE